jgi:gas vesicle protein
MRKVHEKSVLLGIGIGMIITAIAGMIFSAGNNKELSKEEIISRAKGYGLVEQVKIITEESSDTNSKAASDSTAAQNTVTDSTKAETQPSASVASETEKGTQNANKDTAASADINTRNIKIEVLYSYGSQQVIDDLFKKGVISDKEKFTKVLDTYKAATKIRTGTFIFKKNDDMDYIVKTICRMK